MTKDAGLHGVTQAGSLARSGEDTAHSDSSLMIFRCENSEGKAWRQILNRP